MRLGESSEQADLIRWHAQRSEDVKCNEIAQLTKVPLPTQKKVWARVCRSEYDINQKVAEMTFSRTCESQDTSVSCRFANALD